MDNYKKGRGEKAHFLNFVVFAMETEIQRERRFGEVRCAVGVYIYDNEKGLSLYGWATEKLGKLENRERGKYPT